VTHGTVSGDEFAALSPANFCRYLATHLDEFDVRSRLETWTKATEFFANRDCAPDQFEALLEARIALGSRGRDAADGAAVAQGLLERWRYRTTWPAIGERALAALRCMLGSGTEFRSGQLQAIEGLVRDRARLLVVERTGWGKSVVYLIATHLLRDAGSGPTVLISPLLALMRNQTILAKALGVRALEITSTNTSNWDDVEMELRRDECDILLVSPERLANERFQTRTLQTIQRGIGLFVVDEAHCISDWGHDFRPDYRRIVRIVRSLPPSVPVVATAATANDRVVEDVRAQLGPDLRTQRGQLARDSLRLQVIRLRDQSDRLAWLADVLPRLSGTGIVYCLTVGDCDRVAEWLRSRGLDVHAYHADIGNERRIELEAMLLNNGAKALIATVALGMGFDKPDLGFVVHFQRPGSVVSYYQQIGRAGRAVDDAYAILLNGREDDEIQDYFIRTAFPGVEEMRCVVDVLDRSAGLKLDEILAEVNLARGRVEKCLKLLEVDGAVVHEHGRYFRTANAWQPDEEHWQHVTDIRHQELARMREFVDTRECLMEFIGHELDDETAKPCGRCANCLGAPIVTCTPPPSLVEAASVFLKRSVSPVPPRVKWPSAGSVDYRGPIPAQWRTQEGRVLSVYGDAGWGNAVAHDKYSVGRFRDDLVLAAVEAIRLWNPNPPLAWVTAVPSFRHPDLVPAYAERLATALGLPFSAALLRVQDTAEQKVMQNSAMQAANALRSFGLDHAAIRGGPVLLVDDMVDSRWTFTICGMLLRQAGASAVLPFALASTSRGGPHV
jgi:ATP-dependent DNA helicase RecQ